MIILKDKHIDDIDATLVESDGSEYTILYETRDTKISRSAPPPINEDWKRARYNTMCGEIGNKSVEIQRLLIAIEEQQRFYVETKEQRFIDSITKLMQQIKHLLPQLEDPINILREEVSEN